MLYTLENTIEKGIYVEVTLDGRKATKVIEADTIAGYIVRYATDENNEVINENGVVKTEKLFGRVQVKVIN